MLPTLFLALLIDFSIATEGKQGQYFAPLWQIKISVLLIMAWAALAVCYEQRVRKRTFHAQSSLNLQG